MLDGVLRPGVEAPGLSQSKSHPYEGLLLLDALALFRDGEQERGLRCIRKLQESSKLNELVDLICPGFSIQHDRRSQRIRRAILNPGNAHGVFVSRDASPDEIPPRPEPGKAVPASRPLSSRKKVVLGLVRDGLTNRQIAARLLVSENTVKWHLRDLSRQLGASNRCSLIRIAEQRRLIAPPPFLEPDEKSPEAHPAG